MFADRCKCGKRTALGAALLAEMILLCSTAPLGAQSAVPDWEKAAGGPQQFDVASVRQNMANAPSHSNFSLDNGNAWFTVSEKDVLAPNGTLFSAASMPLLHYITFAYKLSGTEELALRMDYWAGLELHVPDWVRNTRYDIEARTPAPATKDQMRLMMQSLLAERFKLKVHWETREVSVYGLVLATPGIPGPQLKPHSASDDCTTTALSQSSDSNASVGPQGTHATTPNAALPIPCGMMARLPVSGPGAHRFGGRNVTMAMLAESMPFQTGLATLDRPLLDKTGLRGEFDFSIEWTPPEDMGQPGDVGSFGAPFREALRRQLGLKLEPQKGPVEVLVIDHAEQPSEN
ncbi:MAG: TIGR03435 family protein [Terracidiphilus sp.]